MQVILKQDVEKIGKVGEVVKVKDGFARNYLLPQGLALLATPQNLKSIEIQKKNKAQELEQEKEKAKALADKLAALSCTISMQINEEDKLYGSVSEIEICKALEDEGFNIDKKCIMLESAIRALGIYEVPVKLHPEVITKIKVWVVKK